jgi:hypothetical protein
VSCGCDSCGDTCCGESTGHRFFNRLKGMFRRNSCGCDTCDTCGDTCATGGCCGDYGAPAPVIMPGTGDKKNAPADKMPDGKGNNNKNNANGASTSPKPINAPALVPNVTVETEKNPF